ncbi:MAG: hypothetical protein GKR89_18720 [Candidatus Latescibacteria bacterium]|nr:hypothetical protein [Candidatus Latescibacterota bacterium]
MSQDAERTAECAQLETDYQHKAQHQPPQLAAMHKAIEAYRREPALQRQLAQLKTQLASVQQRIDQVAARLAQAGHLTEADLHWARNRLNKTEEEGEK